MLLISSFCPIVGALLRRLSWPTAEDQLSLFLLLLFLSTRFSSMARNAGAPLTLKLTCSLPHRLVQDSNSCALQSCARYGYFGLWKYLENTTRRWVSARENQILSLFMQRSRLSDYKMIWIIESLLTNCCLNRKWVIRTKISLCLHSFR